MPLLATLAMLLIYVGTRFEWRLAVGGIVALFHDVLVTIGIFSFLQIEIDLTFVAAILSVVGYSLNDSIVVFDRVRENFSKVRRSSSIEIIDISLSQTLSRTLMTSVTTLFVVLALFYLGGPTLHSFSLALLIGIGFGTYSSIYIAIGVALQLGLKREHMVQPKVEKGRGRSRRFHRLLTIKQKQDLFLLFFHFLRKRLLIILNFCKIPHPKISPFIFFF